MNKTFLYCEIDVPRCKHTYGSAPCDAAVGTTGDFKCFNAPATCQDPENFEPETQVIRFMESTAGNPGDVDAIPNLDSVRVNSQKISPGESLGRRETGTATFSNHPHNDFGFDKYISDRNYNPENKGTFWGKFGARYPNIKGYQFRVIRRTIDTHNDESLTYHYIADSGEIASNGTQYKIKFKDALEFLEGNKFLFPIPSSGVLKSNIDVSYAPFTIVPEGIGDSLHENGTEMYPTPGFASIGEEYFAYTRVGDVITPTERGMFGTELKEHEADETVQYSENLQSLPVAGILERLLRATTLPDDYISPELFAENITRYNNRLYSGVVAEPTKIHELVGELMRDVGLNIYTDLITKKIFAEQIRPRVPTFFHDDNLLDDLSASSENDKRISAFYIKYGRYSPLEKMDEAKNYRASLYRLNDNPAEVLQANTPEIRTHNSRWITTFNRPAADAVSVLMIGRYGTAPRTLSATIPTKYAPQIGAIGEVSSRLFEDSQGDASTLPMQVIEVERNPGNSKIAFEEFRANFLPVNDLSDITLQVDFNNMNLREIYDSEFFTPPLPGTTVKFIADPGVTYGSTNTFRFSLEVGDWPEVENDGVKIEIHNLTILGKGGEGGSIMVGYEPWGADILTVVTAIDGTNGGPALYTRVPVTLVDCIIGGGGGGGGGSGYWAGYFVVGAVGGGGAGRVSGSGDSNGTDFEGGKGGGEGPYTYATYAGDGGNIAEAGLMGQTGAKGGLPGLAVDGMSHLTIEGETTIYGETIN